LTSPKNISSNPSDLPIRMWEFVAMMAAIFGLQALGIARLLIILVTEKGKLFEVGAKHRKVPDIEEFGES